ncbi:MAG: hypothetical protein ACU84Q_01915 [Gammaproteobacteria bacterium]
MKNAYLILIVVATLANPLQVMANESKTSAERSPGDMTVDERREMMAAASKYDNCVYSEAMAGIGNYEDIRAVADFALGECAGKLADLEGLITGWGMPSGYAQSFANRIRQRATRKLLPELAIRKAGG